MDTRMIYTLHCLLDKVKHVNNKEQLDGLIAEYGSTVPPQLIADINSVGVKLISLHDEINSIRKLNLSEQEQAELDEVNRIIDENQFDYHFQPIVSAIDGEIYSYEALMRPRSKLCPSPMQIIRYAELTDRLTDIERATFLNVLSIIDDRNGQWGDRKIFLNSFPETILDDEDVEEIKRIMERNPGRVVVEITEQSQLNDEELEALKALYGQIDAEIAIDDYGTGYSNVQNLLRYIPDYVKIDRSLMSEIHKNKQKRHFVREIVEFCHEYNIKALAEGIETAEELRAVILLGVDLIQGYYTARPSAQIIDSIPYEIRHEIKRYREEREDGKKLHIYTAANSERILLDRLVKEDYRCILVGKNGSGDVTITSSPGLDTDIHIDIAKDYKGCITLENAVLSNTNGRPCIDIGENCDVRLNVTGTNRLNNSGIRVPESSVFTCTGDGQLRIYVDGTGYYAVGNDIDAKHGELIFEQGIMVENHAATGVCIGSGLGGKIKILRGQFIFNMRGYIGIGIGALDADTDLDIFAGDITMDNTLQLGAAIGSYNGNCRVSIAHSSIKTYLSGSDVVGIGTVYGNKAETSVSESSLVFDIVADRCSAVAALNGSSSIDIEKSCLHITSKGDNALALGGYSHDTKLLLSNSDSSVNLITKADYTSYIGRESMEVSGGRTRISVNDEEILL